MRFSIVMMSSLLALTVLGNVTHAQQVSKGTISGTLVQGSTMLSGCDPNPPYTCPEADLFTAPADRFLVITQFCGYCSLIGPAGRIGGAPSGGQCIRFDPGLVIDPGSTVKGRSAAGGSSGTFPCTMVGVLAR